MSTGKRSSLSERVARVEAAVDGLLERAREAAEQGPPILELVRHELDDRGVVSPVCDVEAAVHQYRWRFEHDDWPAFPLPLSLREAA